MIRSRLVAWWPDGHGYGGDDPATVVEAMRRSARWPVSSRKKYMAAVQARCWIFGVYIRAHSEPEFLESLERAGFITLQRREQ